MGSSVVLTRRRVLEHTHCPMRKALVLVVSELLLRAVPGITMLDDNRCYIEPKEVGVGSAIEVYADAAGFQFLVL